MKLFPEDISTAGFVVDRIFYLALWLTGIAFLAVAIALAYFLFRYRQSKKNKAYYTHGESLKARLLTLGLALVVFFAIDVNLAYHDRSAWEILWSPPGDPQKVLRVEIMPQQFVWNIRYSGMDGKFGTADDVANVNQLHVPVRTPVVVALKSKDVIHGFFLPNFRIKQDAVPGLVTYLPFRATRVGTYDIACAEHCGLGHYRMKGILTVESQQDFETWLTKEAQESSPSENWGWDWGFK